VALKVYLRTGFIWAASDFHPPQTPAWSREREAEIQHTDEASGSSPVKLPRHALFTEMFASPSTTYAARCHTDATSARWSFEMPWSWPPATRDLLQYATRDETSKRQNLDLQPAHLHRPLQGVHCKEHLRIYPKRRKKKEADKGVGEREKRKRGSDKKIGYIEKILIFKY
jgi:hypothetical protein